MSQHPEAADSTFRYETLPSARSIRLVQFLPGSAIKCHLQTVEVDKAPAYAALSYTWGAKELEKSLTVNGTTLCITKNLAEAMSALHSYVRDRKLLFWADSVCVNQQDLKERSEQVRLMNSVYRSAEQVLVWLGSGTPGSDFAFDWMLEWNREIQSKRGTTSMTPFMLFGELPGLDNQRAVNEIRSLFHRQWWSRAWIVQESIATTENRTMLCCGDRMMTWEILRCIFDDAYDRYSLAMPHSAFHQIILNGNANGLNQLRRRKEKSGTIRCLDILQFMRGFNCQDPRDRVFAAIGMAMDIFEGDIVPDYNRSCTDTYVNLARFFLHSDTGHSLDILGLVSSEQLERGCDDPESSLPTWVPDWRLRQYQTPFKKYCNSQDFTSETLYAASANMSPVCLVLGNLLKIRGSAIDCIASITQAVTTSNILDLTIQQGWASTISEGAYAGRGTMKEAYDRTLVADISSEFWPCRTRGRSVDCTHICPRDGSSTQVSKARPHYLRRDISRATYGRRLVITSEGYMGLGPRSSKPGDKICMLYGGQVLYILREFVCFMADKSSTS